MAIPGRLDHPSFRTAFGTVVSGLLVLLVMFILLFAIPYGIFTMF